MEEQYTLKETMMFCYSKMEIDHMRKCYLANRNNSNGAAIAEQKFMALSADCLRYIEILERLGLHPNNLEKVAEILKGENS